jgi:hypothetical protein
MEPRGQGSLEADRDQGSPDGLRFKRESSPDVYEALAAYQTSEPWPARAVIVELHRWAVIFDREFRLAVPELALGVDRLRRTRLGHFRYGHNGFALKGEIIINDRYLDSREGWQTLGTLLHELIHAWQQAHGKPGRGNYHNKQFREKAARYGLIVDHRGYTEYEPDSPFTRLLAEHGVNVPPLEQPAAQPGQPAGTSRLKKWSCGCTNVRVAVRSFRARCLNCGREFQPSGW